MDKAIIWEDRNGLCGGVVEKPISNVANMAMERKKDSLYDFVMICKGYQQPEFAENIRSEFEQRAHRLYQEKHRQQNYIVARNRHGIMESFPLVSVTIVSLSNQNSSFANPDEVVEILSSYKKSAKVHKRSVS